MAKKATTQRRRAVSVLRDPELTPEQEAFLALLPAGMVRRAGAKKGATVKGFSLGVGEWLAIIKLILAIAEKFTNSAGVLPPPTE